MAITEEKLYKAFGLEEPAPEPSAPPAGDPSEAPAQQEPVAVSVAPAAEPNPEPGAVSAEPEKPDDNGDSGDGAEKKPLTAEERRENAARRRQQEQQAHQAAIDEAVRAAVQAEKDRNSDQMNNFFASAGMKNTITGAPITNMDEFAAWNQQMAGQRMQKDMQAGKLTPEILDQAISQHPVVQKAQQLVDQAEAEAKMRQQEHDRAVIANELAEIGKRDPSIQKVEDLLKIPEAKEFRDYVSKGYSFNDAHYLATRERREREAAEAVKQQALNNARSKDHLTGTSSARGAGAVSVPADVMALYRKFDPNASEAEIIAHYNKYKKQ